MLRDSSSADSRTSAPTAPATTPAAAARPRFSAVARQVVRVDADTLVRRQTSDEAARPPVTIEPAVDGLDLLDWATTHRDAVLADLRKAGCVLFRGFHIDSSAAFERVATELCKPLYTDYGDLPDAAVGAKVYGSTPYPEDRSILFHNESSHLSSWPKTMCFCCIQPSEWGGETPVVDCRQVHARLDAPLRGEFERKGLRYVRNFVPGFDVHWRQFFRTDDRAAVEDQCRRAGMTCEWWGDDCLRTVQPRSAVTVHPDTGEKIFFNQILLHHLSCLDPIARDALLADFAPGELPRDVSFGDGTPIPDAAVDAVQQACDRAARAFAWERGDVLMVDNMLVAHSRSPYRGARRILVAMGDMVHQTA